ncbi:hypothetical protein IWW50_004078 [Coemansia erecta]|nr:hypothetical protein IWW50_004078 [Coemansia erecta]
MGGADPSSRFISETDIDEARKERESAWKQAYESNTKTTQPPPDPTTDTYDPRTLYERLQAERSKKSDAIAESRRFANQIRKLDDGETEFLDSVDEHERQRLRERKREEMAELAEFKDKVAERGRKGVKPGVVKAEPKAMKKTNVESILARVSGSVRMRDRAAAGLDQKQSSEQVSSQKQSSEQADVKKESSEQADAKKESSRTDSEDEGARKRQKHDTSASQLLSALASYGSDSDSSD